MSVGDKANTLRAQDHGHPPVVCYDARGNGEGGVTPTITGDHNGHINDYMAVVVLAIGGTDSNASITDGKTAPTMLARAGTGGGNEPIVLIEASADKEMMQ